jgi:phosphatidylglycerophosphate synthase
VAGIGLLALPFPIKVARMVEGLRSRRPLRSRERPWAIGLADALVRAGIASNVISLFSVAFAALAGICLFASRDAGEALRSVLFVAAAAGIQLRLLCNLLDGMVAVEGGRGSKSGEVFNDAPDRLADAFVFVGAGYSLPWPDWGAGLGWGAALLAVLTAYARLLGGSLGLQQDFCGPMAKQHRMAVLTAACLISIVEGFAIGGRGYVLAAALAVIVIGSAVTVGRRLLRIGRALEAR